MPQHPNAVVKSVLSSPLLTNPNRWLWDVPKKHAHHLIEEQYYSRNKLAANVFAQMLTSVSAVSLDEVIPKGNSIPVPPMVKNAAHAQLVPSFDKSRNEPYRAIINNKHYIEVLLKKPKLAGRYKPALAAKLGLQKRAETQFVSDMPSIVENYYKTKIQSLLEQIEITEQNNVEKEAIGNQGILLTAIEQNQPFQWKNGCLEIEKTLFGIENDQVVDFKTQSELAHLLVAYMDFLN